MAVSRKYGHGRLAIVAAFTVREAQRGQLDEAMPAARVSLLDTLRFIRAQPGLVHTLIGASVYTLWAWAGPLTWSGRTI
jgi:hypothetical protein